MDDVKFAKGPAVMGPILRKERKKQVKDELDRLKLAEKKKRRLEKALAASAAIRCELEKKKQKKKEEQQRLDEEGAAIAEAVALHVLMDEKPEDSYPFVLDKKKMICVKEPADTLVDFLSRPGNGGVPVSGLDNISPYQRCVKYCSGRSWGSDSFSSNFKNGNWEQCQPLPHRFTNYDPFYGNSPGVSDNGMWNASSNEKIFQVTEISGIIASQAVASLRIAEDVCSASLTARDSGHSSHCLW